jgi:hypothetical protein
MRVADEKGGVLVMVTIWLPVLVLFVMFVLETGNWFVHKRHLQGQADAAAFAGGAMFSDCFMPAGGGDAAIFNEASKYAGEAGSWQGTTYGTALHNERWATRIKARSAFSTRARPTRPPVRRPTTPRRRARARPRT